MLERRTYSQNVSICIFPYRKLKNRVAAQTARDRKKARMTELEESLALLEEQVNITSVN
jgi:hypothetical protein